MLILTLLDAQGQASLKQWRFEREAVVRIGRAPDNQVVLDNDLISRYHLELRRVGTTGWQLLSRGTNGTFINGSRVDQGDVVDGTRLQLAQGGPLLELQLPTRLITQNPGTVQPGSGHAAAEGQLAPLKAQLAQVTDEREQLQDQLADANQDCERLRADLERLRQQCSVAALQERQAGLTARLASLQQLQATVQVEVDHLKPQAERPEAAERLRLTLGAVLADLEQQLAQGRQAEQAVQLQLQTVAQLEAHYQANQALAAQLPVEGSLTESLLDRLKQNLKDLDQELARAHEQHLQAQAKQFFYF